jgi:hypothetical protein
MLPVISNKGEDDDDEESSPSWVGFGSSVVGGSGHGRNE